MQSELACKRAWAEVDLGAIAENYRLIREMTAPSAKICCVIKANAYGHGAVTLARFYEKLGADFLAVSNLEEALELRRASLALPILILGYTPPESASLLFEKNISQCVFSTEYAARLSDAAQKGGVTVKAHFKVDTGMGRIGFDCRKEAVFDACLAEVACAATLPGLCREGIFTHFASADEGEKGADFTRRQLGLFLKLTESLAHKGVDFTLRHAANSAAIVAYPESHLDMVRAGILLYGLMPSPSSEKIGLRPALTLKTVVDLVKDIAPGEALSYGRSFVAERSMRVATLPIGYADGLWRVASEKGLSLSVGGCRAPIVGRICMDQCLVDLTDAPWVKAGEQATVFGGEGESVEALAARLGTIGYEILCALGERIPRVYLADGKVVSVFDRILP